MRHHPVRRWWRLWRRSCAGCGCPWWPCPDGAIPAAMPVIPAETLRRLNRRPEWDAPTQRIIALPDLTYLTRACRWRAAQGGRWRS